MTSKYETNIQYGAQERGFTEGGKIYFSTTDVSPRPRYLDSLMVPFNRKLHQVVKGFAVNSIRKSVQNFKGPLLI